MYPNHNLYYNQKSMQIVAIAILGETTVYIIRRHSKLYILLK
jgi:hypothetical protein